MTESYKPRGRAGLIGAEIPHVTLEGTDGNHVSLKSLLGWSVLFFYPRTGNPDQPAPLGLSDVPNSKGCTPQACGFRNMHGQFLKLGVSNIFGVSSQSPAYQKELSDRLCLTYPVLSDQSCQVAHELGMRTFELEGEKFYSRTTLVLKDSVIVAVFDEIQDPERNANEVFGWLATNV